MDACFGPIYGYDKVGNRLNSLDVATYSYNDSNELTAKSDATYTYDANGNTTSKTTASGTTLYGYDFENHLISVTPPSGDPAYFGYDPFGRRISKVVGAKTTTFLYDGANVSWELIEETQADSTVLRTAKHFTTGLGIDEPLVANIPQPAAEYGSLVPQYFFYQADGLGSITSLSNQAGAVVATYSYDSFGKTTASTESIANPYRYTSREWDADAGLYYYRARYYDATIGRFLNEDPSGFSGGINKYDYVLNRSENLVDPLGLDGHTFGPITWYRNQQGMSPTQIAAEKAHEARHRADFWNLRQFTSNCEELESRGFVAETAVLQQRVEELKKRKCLTDDEKKELSVLTEELQRAKELSDPKSALLRVYCGDAFPKPPIQYPDHEHFMWGW